VESQLVLGLATATQAQHGEGGQEMSTLEEQLKEALANRDLADTRRNQQRVVFDKATEDYRLAHHAWAYECRIWDKAYAEVTRITEARGDT
jgi:hypothetical protein